MKNQFFSALWIAAAMIVAPAAASAQALPQAWKPDARVYTLSENGLYALGGGDGGTLYNVQTREKITIPGGATGWAEVNDVSNNGIVVGSVNGAPASWSVETKTWKQCRISKEYTGGQFLGVTPDGKYAVGILNVKDEWTIVPYAYNLETGKQIDTPNLPVVDLSGEDQGQNAFYDITPDGRYIVGQMSQSYMTPTSMFTYIYDTVEQTWEPIGYTYNAENKTYTCHDKELERIDTQTLGIDGKWLTGRAYIVKSGGQSTGGTEGYCPFRYNMATKELELYKDHMDIAGNVITADGVILGQSPCDNPYPTAMIRSGNYFVSLDQVFSQVYGKTVKQIVGDDISGMFASVAADGRTAILSHYTHYYVLTMPETFAEAAAKVDLLGNYTASIPTGSKISSVSQVTLTFDRAVGCMNQPSKVQLLDSTGKLVRNAAGFAVSNSSDRTITVTFRTTELNPGETYTIKIPAGMIWLKGDTSIKSQEINLSYVGRGTGAVTPVSISPASGSLVAQFNSNPDYIALTFDNPVLVQEKGSCALYNADDNTKVTDFNMGYDGNQAFFFPTSSFMLYRGTNYKVVIEKGTITDLSGNGGNERIELEYVGSYVRQLTDDDLCLFKSACDDYNLFLYWKNNVLNPAAIPTTWGFTKDSLWLLLRSTESSTDWAMASHSMFNPAGESDDWLVVPQIYIPDDKCILNFEAQRYLNAKNDVLKIYVYNDDAVYNYFSKELTDKFRADGDLIFDEVIPAGETDEGLEGEWGEYSLSLAKYAGKNIYIAFVNNNNDQSAIFINNVEVRRDMSFAVTNQAQTVVVDADELPVKGMVVVENPLNEYKGIKVDLLDSNDQVVSTVADADITLKKGDIFDFDFAKALPLEAGSVNKYKIVVTSGEEVLPLNYEVKNLLFECNKKVVLEEYTGSECPNCPLGILAIENLEKLYPNNFIPLTLRTYQSDMYGAGATEYTAFLGTSAAPSGRINRGEILSPMLQNGYNGYTFNGRGITMDNGEEAYLWADAVQDELETPADAVINFSSTYNASTGELTVPVEITFALNSDDISYGVFAVLTENALPCYQMNNLYTSTDPILGQWGQGGIYGQNQVLSWLANDVVRHVINGNAFNGEVISANKIEAGVPYAVNLSTTVPADRIYNADNCHVNVMLINRGTGRILNAERASLGTSGIDGINPDDSNASEAVYYNLQGIRVENPAQGNIYIKVQGNKSTKVLF